MEQNPTVSLIVPVYNRRQVIEETIASVRAQSYENWELILVDDHSTDDSFAILRAAAEGDVRIQALKRRGETRGAPTCRNEGMRAADGEFLMFVDSDDLLAPDCIGNRIEKFRSHTDCDFLVFASYFFCETPGDLDTVWFTASDDYLTSFLEGPSWNVMCPLWKTSWALANLEWQEGLPSWQDWEFHVRALSLSPKFTTFSDLPDTYVRRSDVPRISRKSETDCGHLTARADMLTQLVHELSAKELLTDARRKLMAQQFLRVAVQLRLGGHAQASERAIVALQQCALAPSHFSRVFRRYVAFEANQLLRFPILARTIRKLVKAVFLVAMPGYVIRFRR